MCLSLNESFDCNASYFIVFELKHKYELEIRYSFIIKFEDVRSIDKVCSNKGKFFLMNVKQNIDFSSVTTENVLKSDSHKKKSSFSATKCKSLFYHGGTSSQELPTL